MRAYEPMGYDEVQAVLVPTIRNAAVLKDAFKLATSLKCPVVALCSRWSSADDVLAEAEANECSVVAIDIDSRVTLPRFWTSERTSRLLQNSDLSMKRNIGLALARMSGWQRVVFLDDDMVDLEPNDIAAAAAISERHSVVALRNKGFPDNSVVCHALRQVRQQVGIIQHSFVGGGAMVVAVEEADSFFPNIYNEDWFFMLGFFAQKPGSYPIAVTGEVAQRTYDPFLDPERARVEEFGDCLAEGLYALLDEREPIEKADRRYWTDFITDRRELLARIRGAIPKLDLPRDQRANMIASVQAAEGRNRLITAGLCVDYLRRWNSDRKIWRDYVAGLPKHGDLGLALDHLGLARRTNLSELTKRRGRVPGAIDAAVPAPFSSGLTAARPMTRV